MKRLQILFGLLLMFAAVTSYAQQPPSDPIAENLFPPELVMQHQQALGLSEAQREFFKNELREAQKRFVDLQWKLQDEAEKLAALVKQPQVDETQTLAQLDKLLNAERDIKRAQIALLVRLKNKLTPEQQAQLLELRRSQHK
jgi:Spy/CpxP family protein refolding chaperone